MTILQAFADRVAAHPQRVAIVDGKGRATSYAALEARGRALAVAWAARGIGAGDRVLIAMPVTADLYAALAALWRLGAVAVLPEPALGLAGVRHALAAVRPRAWIGQGLLAWLPLAVPALRRLDRLPFGRLPAGAFSAPSDWPDAHPALISFTSGSTGRPKAIVRTHGFLAAQNAAVAPLLASERDEIDLVGFPVFVLANLGSGVTSVLPNWPLRRPQRAKAAAIRAHLVRHGVTRLLLPPALAELLADAPLPASVDRLFTGGGPIYPDLVDRLTAASPALTIVAVYGSTEAEPIAECALSALAQEDRAAMAAGAGLLAGYPVAGIAVRIADDEIQVAGGHVVQGYLDPDDDAATKLRDADGTIWHRTGDGGRFDALGRLWLRGRLAGRAGGLWPFEIEVAARGWPGVRRCALVPVDGLPVLAIEGDARHAAAWQANAATLDVARIVTLAKLPLDRRHRSKIDYASLGAQVAKASRN